MRRTILSSRFIGRLVIVALSATLAATLAVAAFTSTGAAQATKTLEGVKGFHRGGGHPTYEYMDYPNPGPSNLDNDFPLLKTFTFQFVPSYKACVPEVTGNCFDQVDHHIHDIAIDPHIDSNGNSNGRKTIAFNDKSTGPSWYYNVQHYYRNKTYPSNEVTPCAYGCTTGGEAVGHDTGYIPRPAPASNFEFVLIGFELRFLRNDNDIQTLKNKVDHHINEVGIIENNGQLTVEFNDGNFDDRFEYTIQYAYVSGRGAVFSSLGDSSGTMARDVAQKAIPHGPAVIRGFRFDFKPTCIGSMSCFDHHLKKIGVVNQDGRLEVRYADQNGDDPFNWRVKWGILK